MQLSYVQNPYSFDRRDISRAVDRDRERDRDTDRGRDRDRRQVVWYQPRYRDRSRSRSRSRSPPAPNNNNSNNNNKSNTAASTAWKPRERSRSPVRWDASGNNAGVSAGRRRSRSPVRDRDRARSRSRSPRALPLPVPDEAPRKRRGGKRARKMKQMYKLAAQRSRSSSPSRSGSPPPRSTISQDPRDQFDGLVALQKIDGSWQLQDSLVDTVTQLLGTHFKNQNINSARILAKLAKDLLQVDNYEYSGNAGNDRTASVLATVLVLVTFQLCFPQLVSVVQLLTRKGWDFVRMNSSQEITFDNVTTVLQATLNS